MERRHQTTWWVALSLALLTPITEKNPTKVLSTRAPVVLSAGRMIAWTFCVAMVHQIWYAGIKGWPEAMVVIVLIIAFPLLSALGRVDPKEVVALATSLFSRVGVGGVNPGDTYRAIEARRETGKEFDAEPTA